MCPILNPWRAKHKIFYKSYQRRILFFVECSIWNKKKKKKRRARFSHTPRVEEELTQGILTFIYKASDLMVPQALILAMTRL